MSSGDGLFYSALQPQTAVSTYAVPSDSELSAERHSREKRVHLQVQQRLAERASSDHSGPSMTRYHSHGTGINSKNLIFNGSRNPRLSNYTGGFSSRSAVEVGTQRRISYGAPMPAVVGRPYAYHDDAYNGVHHSGQMHVADGRIISQLEQESSPILPTMGRHSSPNATWAAQEGVASSDHYSYQGQSMMSGASPMRRSLSGTLGCDAAGRGWKEAEHAQQYSFKGPAHRTINRMNNRQIQQQRVGSFGSQWQQSVAGSNTMMGGGHFQNSLRRAGSLHSLKSVGRGVDISDAVGDGIDVPGGFQSLDMATAVSYLGTSDVSMQMLGAAFIQHQCYHSNEAKELVRSLRGIPALVQLYNSENQEVQRYATGATRNLIYENMDNKTSLIESGGISKLVAALKEPDDELRKNITGILWNLSSKESLKERLARESLAELTDRVLIPLSGGGDSGVIQQSLSETDIFYNTTGCLRNMSSVNGRTRQQMRDTRGLVESLIAYIKLSLEEGKTEDKGLENCVCVLRNLSFQLYSEIPASVQQRLDGPSRAHDTRHKDAIGCFTPQGKKVKDQRNYELSALSEVARVPRAAEWLWHPQIVGIYNQVLQNWELSSATREGAAGALQNITAGDGRWASVLSRVALEQERILPVILDKLRTPTDAELRSLTGLLRNLSRHAKDKADMATKVVNILVSKLPSDGYQKEPSSDVVVNICGVLNNLVIVSSVAARDITYFDGLPKLIGIKTSHDNSPGKLKAAKAAATVLSNMYLYSKLHRDYKQKGFTKRDFSDA